MKLNDRGTKLALIPLLGFLLFSLGNSLVGYWRPSARVPMGDRVGKDGSHQGEKLATKLLTHSLGVVGVCFALRRRAILGLCLVGTCYALEGVRREVFYVWEGGRLFDKDYLGPWIFLMLGLPMFWLAYREHREREEALAVLEEIR